MLALLLVATLSGHWEGSIRLPALELPLVLDLASDSAGRWTGSVTFPGLNVKGAQLLQLEVHDSTATFVLKGVLGDPKFETRLNADGSLSGQFLEGGNKAPLTLRRTGEPQVDLPPAPAPVRKELEGAWTGEFPFNDRKIRADLTLSGITAKLKLTGRREFDIPVSLVADEEGLITIDSAETRMGLELRFNPPTSELRGTFHQGSIESPITLRRP